MMQSKDQLGNNLIFTETPKRIVSLVPSQSELLWDLGLNSELVGITKFCVHPDIMFHNTTRVGGTKQLDLEKIRALKPDLIIGNKEENDKQQIEELSIEFKVWISEIYTFEDAFNMMRSLGKIVGRAEKAEELIRRSKLSVTKSKDIFEGRAAAYFIWNKPYLFAGKNTFIDYVLTHVGFINVLKDKHRYPELSIEELKELKPKYCLLSTEPFPFDASHAQIIKSHLPETKVCSVDGEMFSWYGSRLIYLYDYLHQFKREIDA